MVSIKSLALLTLAASIVTAVPQYGHARFHWNRAVTGADLAETIPEENHHHHHKQNETECGHFGGVDEHSELKRAEGCSGMATHTEFVTSTNVATVTAPVRRWDHTHTWGGRPWGQSQATPAASPAASNPAVGISVGVSIGDGSGSTATATGSAVSTATSSPVAGGASTGGKKGLSYNTNSLLTQFSGASWAYNWAASAGGSVPSGIEFVPMLWGKDGISAWAGAVKSAIASGSSHILSFNEPDFPQQSNLDASTAAQLHIANMAPYSGQVKVGGPAFTNSNIAGQGLDWAKAFFAACGGAANNCKIDFMPFHWYNAPGTMDDFKSHVSSVISLAKANGVSKVWLTEFAVTGSSSDQASFLAQALPFLDAQPEVERYAYFMVGNGQMLTNNALNVVGQAYNA